MPADVLVSENEKQVNILQYEEGEWLHESSGECKSDQSGIEIEENSRFSELEEEGVAVKFSKMEMQSGKFSEIEEDVRFAGLSQLANYKYCLQCKTNHLLGTM